MSNISERIIAIRKYKSLNQKEFAELILCPRSSLSEIESGKRYPSFEFIVELSNKMPDINLQWLIKGEGDMYKNSANEPINMRRKIMMELLDALPERQQEEILSVAQEKERLVKLEQQVNRLMQQQVA